MWFLALDTFVISPPRVLPPKFFYIPYSTNNQDDDTDEQDLVFKLPQNASYPQVLLARFLSNTLNLPDVILLWIFSIKIKHLIMFFCWLFICPIAARYDVGPIFILTTIFLLMIFNLGRRHPGESSAYSWFNEGFRALPGQLNANVIDQQIRRGQM